MDRFAAYGGRVPLMNITFALCVGVLLAGCGNTSNGGVQTSATGIGGQGGPAPVSLVKSFGGQSSSIQKVALDGGAVAKAVERYRINKKSEPSPYKKVGVDLNGDGQAEALVYLTGEAWCAKTGCTLAVFRNGQYGYRPMATIRRVKLPIRVGAAESQGWRELVVDTGGAGMPVQTVALRFSGRGYPGNATTIAPIPQGVPHESVVILDGPALPPIPVGERMPVSGQSDGQSSNQGVAPVGLNP